MWAVVPALIAAAVFITHTFVLGEPLTPAMGFSCLTIFNLLQFPLLVFPDMINMFIRAKISIERIISYLETDDVRGIPRITDYSYAESRRNGSLNVSNVTMGWNKTLNDLESPSEKINDADNKEEAYYCVRSCASLSRYVSIYGRRKNSRQKYSLVVNQGNTKSNRRRTISGHADIELSEQKARFETNSLLFDSATESDSHYVPPGSEASESQKKLTDFTGKVVLDNLTWEVEKGSLTVIVGMTGAGKSSLLQGVLLGEGQLLGGATRISGSISYVSQTAWIQNATLKDNVLFGSEYDKARYEAVLHACALEADLKLLPLG